MAMNGIVKELGVCWHLSFYRASCGRLQDMKISIRKHDLNWGEVLVAFFFNRGKQLLETIDFPFHRDTFTINDETVPPSHLQGVIVFMFFFFFFFKFLFF